jgi:hypothetical protein
VASKLMGYYDMALNKDEQAGYDYAMDHSDMQGPCRLGSSPQASPSL